VITIPLLSKAGITDMKGSLCQKKSREECKWHFVRKKYRTRGWDLKRGFVNYLKHVCGPSQSIEVII